MGENIPVFIRKDLGHDDCIGEDCIEVVRYSDYKNEIDRLKHDLINESSACACYKGMIEDLEKERDDEEELKRLRDKHD